MTRDEQHEREGLEPIHTAEDGTCQRDGYRYGADGIGVRVDLVEAVLDAWTRISPTGDPASSLRSVSSASINSVDNLARLAAVAVARTIASSRP
ncbi:hypothetical protein ACWDG9_16770 [Streptomyces sp. NPDC001073]